MMDDSKKRFQIGFIGSLGFHLFVFLVLAFAGLFTANNVDDKIVEIAFLAVAEEAEEAAAAV